ncbi:outer membrane family protein [Helicobacter himalayensis]|uniref:outer membrane family protein n=1 Tax=Helicobacter himalayensis TaxID=1591088 RepID=UPI003D6F5D87
MFHKLPPCLAISTFLTLANTLAQEENLHSQTALDSQISQHLHHHHHNDGTQSLHDFEASVGVFGKTSALSSKRENARRDNYSMLYAKMFLEATMFPNLYAGLGAQGFAPFQMDTTFGGEKYDYLSAKFVANQAYLSYKNESGRHSVGLKLGRFEDEFDWVGHSLQGAQGFVKANIFDDTLLKVSALWVNEQAHITREFSSDFNFYRDLYDRQNLYMGEIGLTSYHASLKGFGYVMPEFFSVFGGKTELEFGKRSRFYAKTMLQYAYLDSLFKQEAHHHEHSHSHEGHTHNIGTRGDTYLVWLEQTFAYKNKLEFGAGFQQIGTHFFEIANMGTTMRFEAHNHAHNGFGVIAPGGMHNGSHTTNMYEAKARTWYAFLDYSIRNTSFEVLARNSVSAQKTQNALSLGVKHNFTEQLEIGAIGIYMLEKHEAESALNKSFAKAYFQVQL